MPEIFIDPINLQYALNMYYHECNVRVRYGETDQMGYVYYGVYAQYFEVARVEMLRSLGLRYKSFESDGVIMPVLDLRCKYLRPGRYDDLLLIKTCLDQKPATRIHFTYQLYNENEELITLGETTLVFVSKSSGKPCPPPPSLLVALADKFD